jgi:hypothetical protein
LRRYGNEFPFKCFVHGIAGTYFAIAPFLAQSKVGSDREFFQRGTEEELVPFDEVLNNNNNNKTYAFVTIALARGIRNPSALVTGRRAASGYVDPPFNGTQTTLPSKTVVGQNESLLDFCNPIVSNIGIHS